MVKPSGAALSGGKANQRMTAQGQRKSGSMKADKELVRALVKMSDVLSAYGIRADKPRIPCPIHQGKDNNFTWKADSWHCFVCNDGGDIFKFVQSMNGCTFPEALEWLCSVFDIPNDNKPDPELQKRIRARQEATEALRREREYQNYVWTRMCDYLHWLQSQEQTCIVATHSMWCNRLLDRMFAQEFNYNGFSVDDRLRGMWQQHGR